MTNGDDAHVPGAGNYAEVNGLSMYYEVHGSGETLILLHGGVGAIEMFGEVLPLLAEGRQVVAIDLQVHGRTAEIDRPLSYEMMADDIAALIGHLDLEKADVMGYSLGGGVALQTAIRHPEVVRKLVLVSTPFTRDSWYPEILAGMGQMGPEAAEPMKQTPSTSSTPASRRGRKIGRCCSPSWVGCSLRTTTGRRRCRQSRCRR